ncbi:MAG: right-handed parallel beta-helix repeat-containing protein, partial [Desulfobacteraceae bacterium]
MKALSAKNIKANESISRLIKNIFIFLPLIFLFFPVTESSAETYVSGEIRSDTTWTVANSPYIVTGDITVRYNTSSTATLTIEPGVEVKFNSGTGLYIGYSDDLGALYAQGTEEEPIIFTSNAASPGAGDWRGIYFRDETNDSASRLEHCVVEYAGSSDSSAIMFNRANIPLLNSTIQYSSTNGIYLSNSSSTIRNCIISDSSSNGIFLAGSSNPAIGGDGYGNTISNSGSYAIYANDNGPIPHISNNTISDYGSYAMRLGARMNVHDNVYSGSGIRGIVVLGDRVDRNTIWSNETPLYIVTGDLDVRYNTSSTATLTIEPGVEVKFNSGAGIYLGYSDDHGALYAQGTEEDPIIFTSNATTPGPGDWEGIYFRSEADGSASRIEHCVVEYAGASINTAVYVNGVNVPILNSTIQYSSSNGIYLVNSSSPIRNCIISNNSSNGIFLAGSSNPAIGGESYGNTISNSGSYAIYANDNGPIPHISYNTISDYESYAMRLGARMNVHDNVYSGSGIRGIVVLGDRVDRNTIWSNETPLYIVTGDLDVRYNTSSTATL